MFGMLHLKMQSGKSFRNRILLPLLGLQSLGVGGNMVGLSRWMRRKARPEIHGREVETMGRYCEVCQKSAMSGHKVSHSNRKSNRKWAPNVQRVRVMVGAAPTRLNVCTRCLRSGYVARALPKVSAEA